MIDLWPENIIDTELKLKSPVNIIREQASLLGKRTQNLVKGEVEEDINYAYDEYAGESIIIPREEFQYIFYLISPALSGYHYRLFTISYGIPFYPVSFHLDSGVADEINDSEKALMTQSEEEFLEALRKIFRAKKTWQVIHALQAQMESTPESNAPDSETPF